MIAWAELEGDVARWDQLSPRQVDAVLHRLLARNNLLPGNFCRRAAASYRLSARLHSLRDFSRRLASAGAGAGFGTSERV